jgi:hypothetical protein
MNDSFGGGILLVVDSLISTSKSLAVSLHLPYFALRVLANYGKDVICLSVVDVSVLKTSEFVYLISEYAGE